MSEFYPKDNYYRYDYFSPNIYRLALNNRYISGEIKKFLKEGKIIIDDLIRNKAKSRFLNLVNSERFRIFFKKLIVSCFIDKDELKNINQYQKAKYDLGIFKIKESIRINYKNSIFTGKLCSDFSVFKLFNAPDNRKLIEIPSNFEGSILAMVIINQYLFETIDLVGRYISFTKLFLNNLCSDEFNVKYLSVSDIFDIKEINRIIIQYFMIKYVFLDI